MDDIEQIKLAMDTRDSIDSRIKAAKVARAIIDEAGPSRHLPETFPKMALDKAATSLVRMQASYGNENISIDSSRRKLRKAYQEIDL